LLLGAPLAGDIDQKQAPALSSKCGQCHVYSRRRKLNTDLIAMTWAASGDAVTLTLDALMAMTSVVNGQDIVQLAARHALLSHVKRQPAVRDVFFLTSSRQPVVDSWSPELAAVLQGDVTWFDFSRYSVLYVAETICKLRDEFLIHTMLEEDIVNEQLKAMHDSSDWKKIG